MDNTNNIYQQVYNKNEKKKNILIRRSTAFNYEYSIILINWYL